MNMSKQDGGVRSFNHYRSTWFRTGDYADGTYDQISVNIKYIGVAGMSSSFEFVWHGTAGNSLPSLIVSGATWSTLPLFSDLFAEIAKLDGFEVAPQEMCDVLVRCGIADCTERTAPVVINDEIGSD